MKDFNYDSLLKSKLFGSSSFGIRNLGRLIYNIEYINEQNIPNEGNFIVAPNHVSRVDGFLIMAHKGFKDIHFMAMAKLFRKPVQGAFLKSLNCFPVKSGKGQGKPAVEYAINLLKCGEIVGIMPEGGINRTDDMSPRKGYNGISIIAKETGKDILPVGIHIEGKLRFGATIKVSFGEVIKNEELDFEDLNNSTNYVMEKITQQWSLVSNNEYKKQPLKI